jgi:DNA-binding transcriptional LysR family regulator
MDYTQLRSFIAVANHGHLTRAAESLHLSQPAVSGHIKALEEGLDVTLFVRTASGMELTPAGRVLLAKAENAVDALLQFRQAAKHLGGDIVGKLKLGTVLDPTTLRIGELLAHMLERHPRLELDVHQVVSNEALADVRSGALDASFYFGAEPGEGLSGVPLRDITYRVCMPAAWSKELRKADWPALAARPWIAAPGASSQRRLVLGLFEERGMEPERLIEADNEAVIANLIESGLGLSVLREEIAQPLIAAGQIVVWPAADLTTRLWLTFATARRNDPLLEALLDGLTQVWDLEPWRAADPSTMDAAAALEA